MGLSETERAQGIYHNIKKITSFSQELETNQAHEKVISKIKELCSGLWHDFLGKNRNSAHWILGSSAENKVTWESSSPWGIAVLYGIQNACEKENFWDVMPFDVKEHLNIQSLLRNSGDRNLSRVFDIYSHLESLLYNLRRYDDQFLEEHASLSKTVSTLMGYCYSVFTEEKETCAKAYLLHRISEMLLLFPYTKDTETDKEKMDVIGCLFQKLNFLWDYSGAVKPNSNVQLRELCRFYKELLPFQRGHTLNTPDGIECRLFAILSICRKNIGSEYRRTQILSILKENKVKYDKKRLEVLFKSSEEDSIKRNKDSMDEYSKAQNFAEDYMFEGLDE